MALESPATTVFVARLPESDVSLAAINLFMTISFWIEAPVIGLLPTATALALNKQHLLVLRSFVTKIMILVTLVGIVVAFTPLYDFITIRLLKSPFEVADAGRLGLIIMIPWSAAIAWRRFKQGVLIRYGYTSPIGKGTVVRLLSIVVVAGMLYSTKQFSGAVVAAFALVSGVIAEACYVHWVARPVIHSILVREDADNEEDKPPPLDMRSLLKFHIPLSFSVVFWLLARPIFFRGLAVGANPVVSLAAWEILMQLMFFFRAPGMALPEAIIALQKNSLTERALKTFCFSVGIVSSALLLVLLVPFLSDWVIREGLGVTPHVGEIVSRALPLAVAIPLISAMQSFYKGQLSAVRRTITLMISMGIYVGSIFVLTVIAVFAGIMNVYTATWIYTLSVALELGYLVWSWKKYKEKVVV